MQSRQVNAADLACFIMTPFAGVFGGVFVALSRHAWMVWILLGALCGWVFGCLVGGTVNPYLYRILHAKGLPDAVVGIAYMIVCFLPLLVVVHISLWLMFPLR